MTRHTRRFVAAIAVPVLAAVLVAGCSSGGSTSTATSAATAGSQGSGDNGIADKSAKEILTAAEEGLASAQSFGIKGGGTQGSERFTMDMGFVPGNGARGKLSIQGKEFELLVTGGKTYAKATEALLTSQGVPAEAVKLLKGKWLVFPGNAGEALNTFTDGTKLADKLLDPRGTLTKGDTDDINGVSAIAVLHKTADPDTSGTYWIATQGEPRPLRLEPAAGASSHGALDFSYDIDVDLAAPPEDQVVDLSALTGGGGLPGGSAG